MTKIAAVPKLLPIVSHAANLQVHDQIRNAIMRGGYKPGEALTTRKVAELLNVSQMPVREAFHRLVAEGALENRSNRTFGLPILTRRQFEELTEIRMEIEGLASEKAARAGAGKRINFLRSLVARMEKCDAADYLTLNREFHFTIYEMANSATLLRMIEQLWTRVGPLFTWSSSHAENVRRSHNFHRDAVEAIALNDGPAARQAIIGDLREAANILLETWAAIATGSAARREMGERFEG